MVLSWRTALLGGAELQLLALAAALLGVPRNRTANRWLAALLTTVAGLLTPFALGYAGAYDAWKGLTFAPFALPLAVGPLAYAYVRAFTGGRAPGRMALHLAPAAAHALYLDAAFLLPSPVKMAWYLGGDRSWARSPRTRAEAFVAFTGLTASVRCGHSFLNPANQEGPGFDLIAGGRDRLPFRFVWLNGRMIVLDGMGADPALRAGAEVTAIGGVAPSRILQSLTPLAAADGHNDGKRVRQLEVRGEETWEPFDLLLPRRWPGLVRTGEVVLRVSPSSGAAERTVAVRLLDRAERLAGRRDRIDAKGSEPVWRMELSREGVATLRMPTWALFDSRWDWRAALDADLDALTSARARALVLDLRGNAGGLDVGDAILARRVTHDVRKSDLQRFTRYRRTPSDLDPRLKTWDRTFRDWGADALGPDARGFYRMTRFDDDPAGDLIRPHPRPFKGALIVLIDAADSSATFGFAEAAKRNGLATLVGGATGGNLRGINGSAFFFVQLPGTGLEADLPLVALLPPTPRPDRLAGAA